LIEDTGMATEEIALEELWDAMGAGVVDTVDWMTTGEAVLEEL